LGYSFLAADYADYWDFERSPFESSWIWCDWFYGSGLGWVVFHFLLEKRYCLTINNRKENPEKDLPVGMERRVFTVGQIV
jgi:hypothetical protein